MLCQRHEASTDYGFVSFVSEEDLGLLGGFYLNFISIILSKEDFVMKTHEHYSKKIQYSYIEGFSIQMMLDRIYIARGGPIDEEWISYSQDEILAT